MNRRYTFSGGQKAGAAIVSRGALTTNAGGYIVLATDRVSNSGTIRTPDGKAVLAATERVTLQLDNGGLTSVQVTGDVVNATVENRGLVSARNGQVFLTAHGRDMLMNTVLNVSGVVEAGGMHRRDGNIVLDGGNSGVVHLSGVLRRQTTRPVKAVRLWCRVRTFCWIRGAASRRPAPVAGVKCTSVAGRVRMLASVMRIRW